MADTAHDAIDHGWEGVAASAELLASALGEAIERITDAEQACTAAADLLKRLAGQVLSEETLLPLHTELSRAGLSAQDATVTVDEALTLGQGADLGVAALEGLRDELADVAERVGELARQIEVTD